MIEYGITGEGDSILNDTENPEHTKISILNDLSNNLTPNLFKKIFRQ